jgi:hypothetical protein
VLASIVGRFRIKTGPAQGIPLVIVMKPVGAEVILLPTSEEILPSWLPISGILSFPLGRDVVGIGACTIDVAVLDGAAKDFVDTDTVPCTSSPWI